MTSRETKTAYANPASAGTPIISPTADERLLVRHPRLLHWWDAGHGFDKDGWRCRKTRKMLVKERTALPTLQNIAAYRTVPSLFFTSGINQLWDGGQNLFPAGEFTQLVVGRSGPNQNSFIAGAATVGRTDMTYLQNSDTDAGAGSQGLRINSGGALGGTLTDLANLKYADGPAMQWMAGKPQEVGALGNNMCIRTMRVDTGVISETQGDTAAGALPNVHREFHVSGVNPYGSAAQGQLVGGDIGLIMLFDVALHFDTALRDLAERVIRARYSIPVPAA
ncbi:hypothetical protein N6H05_01565 [Sphingobium sp. WTD-1]|uniref:hypothetical protein n=1 Tax=Sphingobium sp. WTD-1 TaxID=2979467 RepID=UPI0024DEF688|nr:hypothetical protein [Sphingobium sp. WTD-1]WIA56541.1 hypothetical protein N6H05_01565 [Sphingobium sp. WTD-1]